MSAEKVKATIRVPRVKRVHAGTTVDEIVILRLEALGIDVAEFLRRKLNEAAGHHVCPTCGGLLKPIKKKV